MIHFKYLLLTFFLITGCATAGELALNTAAGAIGNMIDRRVEDQLGNDAGLSDEKLDGKITKKSDLKSEKINKLKEKVFELESRLVEDEEALMDIYETLIEELEFIIESRLKQRGFTEREDDYECIDCKTDKWGRTLWRL
tara:strand:- start:286 stop:705 length:420 start_codon:yes stop_codon:yes gene_type:complete